MTPSFWEKNGTDIYTSNVVQSAMRCIVYEMKKLEPKHIKFNGRDIEPVDDDIQTILSRPNPLMTMSDFIEKTTWLLLLNYNAFILPEYITWEDSGGVHRRYKALWPIQPSQVDFLQGIDGAICVKFTFSNGEIITVDYNDVIHLREQYSVNEVMGGNRYGQPDHKALIKSVALYEEILTGIAKALKASYAINGIIKVNSIIDIDDTEEAARRLERQLDRNESGFIVQDLKGEVIPFERKTEIVDSDTIKFLDETILRYIGVPLCILTGDYTKEQYEAFYQKTLEPRIIAMSQAFTAKLFTPNQIKRGHNIKFYPEQLIFLSVSQVLQMIEELSPTGGMYENEKRQALGLVPLPELVGKRYVSLNWIEADLAAQYQTGQLKGGKEVNESE